MAVTIHAAHVKTALPAGAVVHKFGDFYVAGIPEGVAQRGKQSHADLIVYVDKVLFKIKRNRTHIHYDELIEMCEWAEQQRWIA